MTQDLFKEFSLSTRAKRVLRNFCIIKDGAFVDCPVDTVGKLRSLDEDALTYQAGAGPQTIQEIIRAKHEAMRKRK